MPGRSRIASLIAAGLLAFPAAAGAQSAGDDQYQDPFAGEQEQEQEQESQAQEPESTPAPTSGAAQEPAPAAPEAATAQAPSGEEELPRTGADTGLLALGGTLLLVGGVALRVRVSEPAPRRR
jgi:LPXTG-motif cell wall-anchored protein